ncbi:uncharacterized protein CIMG_10046 [Coccidioides immitis RS]|uniref:Uncharacterized protein n=4 Tax=Coccidioides immitis TaxID=5501 RepID=J3K0P9_COCIM|nr:uncharacterized protein CIMG_10046 [Coccidioides immitis RS]EAS27441.3 hypothetical protein CIMG_10046 [Coccidioides immitis RS]KMP09395.1 hypothetical protein CIRG_09565 [Coccidioides immitis RMSCC 2394]KMU75330.1 hypothetical protein CISG_04749 [Coccidioides immitis RMSCC 3703]KMU88484.1 hypothetical protein CIHG_06284 [Coccidioides immitis H538.4]
MARASPIFAALQIVWPPSKEIPWTSCTNAQLSHQHFYQGHQVNEKIPLTRAKVNPFDAKRITRFEACCWADISQLR